MRYAYSVTSALLLGGAALSLVTGLPAGAQIAQNDDSLMQAVVPRAGAPASFADLTAQLQPAVVNISVRQKVTVDNPLAGTPFGAMMGPGGQSRLAQAVGSGFVVSADGFVVTNNHVISLDRKGAADEVSVKFADGVEYPARIVGRDVDSDLAVLKIDAKAPLPFVQFGESSKARAGDWVIAIGNPFGLGGSVTSGIISSVNRNTGTGAYDHYIQTDASINSGNSGGPMFDMRGKVIGINNWIVAPSGGNIGIGFAIPSDIAKPIVEKLMSGKAIERGFLGVQIQPITDEMADSLGLQRDRGELVRGVPPGMPGDKAGIKPGDIVLKVNNVDVTPDRSLSTIVANIAPGTRIPIDLLRQGKNVRQVKAMVVQADAQGVEQVCGILLGVFGTGRTSEIPSRRPVQPPVAVGAEASTPLPYLPGLTPNFTQHLDFRLAEGAFPFTGGGDWLTRYHLRLKDGAGVDPELITIILADAGPTPALSQAKTFAPASSVSWALELRPVTNVDPEGLWRLDQDTIAYDEGYANDRAHLWTPDGQLAAFGYQVVAVYA